MGNGKQEKAFDFHLKKLYPVSDLIRESRSSYMSKMPRKDAYHRIHRR
jgi:hypothetical protein